jgi:hypothetical protein
MGAPLPLSVKVEGRTAHVVIEPTFALSPLGLFATMRLALRTHVWLGRGMRGILDHSVHLRDAPAELGPAWLRAPDRDDLPHRMAEELALWHRAWTYGRLAAQVNWVGDAHYESVLPERTDALLLTRFEACRDALDRRCLERRQPEPARLDECSRDALALAAALQPDWASILTRGGEAGTEPPLCRWLDEIGIPGAPAPRGASAANEAALAEALMPLAAVGAPVAVVHLIAPGVLTLPETWSDGDWLDEYDEAGEDLRARIWNGAFALWQPLEVAP